MSKLITRMTCFFLSQKYDCRRRIFGYSYGRGLNGNKVRFNELANSICKVKFIIHGRRWIIFEELSFLDTISPLDVRVCYSQNFYSIFHRAHQYLCVLHLLLCVCIDKLCPRIRVGVTIKWKWKFRTTVTYLRSEVRRELFFSDRIH